MIGIVFVKQCITTGAASIVILVTVTTEGGILVTVAIIGPDCLTAPIAGCGMPLIAFSADYLAIDLFVVFILADKCSAV